MSDPTGREYPKLRMYIDGEWLDAGGRDIHRVVNPATGATLGELPLAGAGDLDRALDAAQRGFVRWRNTPPAARGRVLIDAAGLLRRRADRIARNATREEGKVLSEAMTELEAAADLLEYYGQEARRIYGRVLPRPSGTRSLVVKEPVGPVAAFAPWNFPIHNPARKLGSPLAAGCSVILKPAEEAPASAIAVVEALVEAGCPGDVVQLVFGIPDQVSRHLLASPIIRKLSFTGSTEVGKHLVRLASATMKRTTMELGGHAPAIVFDDCDLDRTVETLAAAKLRNAGQVCVSPTRFYVQEGIYDRFVTALAARMGAAQLGDGLIPAMGMGPMANARRPAAMAALIDDAIARGARLLTGGEPGDSAGFFWRPTVLSHVGAEARIMREEPFGPVAVAAPFATLDEAVQCGNRLPFGLAAFAFTENGRRANLIADALEAGMIGINTTRIAAADAPFGGVKESGHGSEDGPEGVDACLVTKAIHTA